MREVGGRREERKEAKREGGREERVCPGAWRRRRRHTGADTCVGFHRVNRSLLQDKEAGNGMMSHVHGALNHTLSICKGGGHDPMCLTRFMQVR